MSKSANNIQVQTINHLGIIAGIIDEIGIVEIINEQLGIKPQEKLNNGIIVKSIILNALGFVSRPFPALLSRALVLQQRHIRLKLLQAP